VKVHRTTKKPIWERYQSWLNAPQDPAYGSKGQALLYGYVVTKNHSYLDQAWKFYGDRLYVNGKDRSQGLRPFFGECGKAIYCKDREAANPGGFLVMEIALLYDWGFDGLNANQRVDVVEWLNNSSEYNYRQNAYVHAHFSDEGAAILLGLGAAAYATYGENRPASGQMVWFREEWAHTLRAMDAIGRGGATGPPNTYDEKAASALINLANLVYYASAENLFLAHPWFQRRLALEAFAADGNAKSGASRPSGLALSRRFSGTEEADIWNSIFRQPGSDESPDAWTDLYYYSQAPALTKPSRLSLFDPGMGNVFIRSAWTAPDATAIHFWAGPHVSDRQALDQGSFTLSNRADPAAPGQIAKAPEPVDYEDYFARQDLYDVAKVANFGDNRQAVAWVADITNAYSKTQVAKAFRRCVYLREADVLIVADTLESLSPETPKIAQVRAIGKVAPELSKFDNADSFGASFNSSGKSYKVTFSKATSDAPLVEGMDLQAPVISNVKPGPVLPAGTGRTMLSLTTNEPAQCRFSYKPGTTYPYMSGNFTSANGLTHTVQSGTLDGGDTYTYYIRCQDKSGNENLEDLRLRFSVNIK
jgi:hypothetical protein